jgi:RNA polymerase sigma-70 factor (ECF subfamily)
MAPDDASDPDAAVHADARIAGQLRAGDEAAFAAFARAQHPVMVRIAAARLQGQPALVEEIVQEAWVVFLESLPRYEARSSLRTFLAGIVLNVLRNRTRSEGRSVPFSSLGDASDDEGPVVAVDRFLGSGERWAGHWAAPPRPWDLDPVDQRQVRETIELALGALPEAQRDVLTLRDVFGWDPSEICNALSITDTHQRVLLHRARAKVRSALEARFGRAQ